MRTKKVINIIKNQSDKLKYAAIIGTTLLIAVDAKYNGLKKLDKRIVRIAW